MLVLALSGLTLVARRTGGRRRVFTRLKGPLTGRLHAEVTRIAVAGLVLSSLTALWMTASTFGYLPQGAGPPPLPAVSGQTGMALTAMPALRDTLVTMLRDLTFPYPDDPSDAFTLSTAAGVGEVDQGTGALLGWTAAGGWDRVSETIYMLHTGRGAAVLGLIMGVMALGVPVMAVTGIWMWVAARRGRPRLRGNVAAGLADTILLVGSETNATWGFAKTLHEGLTTAGCRVHVAPMNQLAGRYPKAQRLLLLTSTYGDGDAPASASQFLHRLEKLPVSPGLPWAVLGFGDRQFDNFCAFADQITEALQGRHWPQILGTDYVDRQSAQSFERWCTDLGTAIGMPLNLHYTPLRQATRPLLLVEREDYGSEVSAPTSILRFKSAAPHSSLPSFIAGDLVGILAPGSDIPRFYSLASASKDGVLEVCVRRLEHGLCSTFLCDMKIGACADSFIQKNPRFQPASGKGPIILIGAGTGIGPLAGFIRANKTRRPMHLYWGGRLAQSDFLYENQLQAWLADRRLTGLHPAFSRCPQPAYVQDKLREDSIHILALLATDAQFLVCGGRRMAADVAVALDTILAPLSLSVAALKKSGRYLEDTY